VSRFRAAVYLEKASERRALRQVKITSSENNLVITQPAPEIAKQVILVVDDDEAASET
jgi:hypothetical protein